MAKKAKQKNRYNRNSTKRRWIMRPLKHPFRLLFIALGCVTVIVTAVVWGNILQYKSEQYRADREAGRWRVETEAEADPLPAVRDVPNVNAWPLAPRDGLEDFYSGRYSAATLWLCREDGTLPYLSEVGAAAGYTCGESPLSRETQKLHNNDLRAVGVFTVRSLAEPSDSDALTHYRMQTELAILEEYAAAGLDELVLVGLPTDAASIETSLEFVRQVRQHLTADNAPLLGISVSPALMATAMEGSSLPAYCLTVCDFLAMDLTDPALYGYYAGGTDVALPSGDTPSDATASASDEPAFTSELSRLLYRYRYPYVRYKLRLLFTDNQKALSAESADYGFNNILTVMAPEATDPDSIVTS